MPVRMTTASICTACTWTAVSSFERGSHEPGQKARHGFASELAGGHGRLVSPCSERVSPPLLSQALAGVNLRVSSRDAPPARVAVQQARLATITDSGADGSERALHDFERRRTERQRERELVTLRGHLLPGFLDYFGHF